MNSKVMGALIGSLLIFVSCQKKQAPVETETATKAEVIKIAPAVLEESTPASTVAAETNPEIEKGRRLYLANCLQCHNRDPGLKGSIGPEMTDAPLEVMISKIMTGKYPEQLPEGFVPKRNTRAMRPIPKLKEDIPAIWKYVQSQKKK